MAQAASPAGEVPHRGLITLSIMLATIMQGVDNTIANVALPYIQGSLSAAQDQIAWVLTSYIVAAAITMPLTGWLAGRFGIKYLFLISVGGFTIASAACGWAPNIELLVAFRALQGVAAAAMVPQVLTSIQVMYAPHERGTAMGIFSGLAGLASVAGPIIGEDRKRKSLK